MEVSAELFYKYIDEGWDSPPLRIGNPSVQPNHASVAALDRTVLLAWREFDGNAYSVKLMHSADAGSTWSDSIPLMESAGASDYPIPLVDAKKVLVVWNTAKDGLRVLRMDKIRDASIRPACEDCSSRIDGSACVPVGGLWLLISGK
jgi:hypothetical protein